MSLGKLFLIIGVLVILISSAFVSAQWQTPKLPNIVKVEKLSGDDSFDSSVEILTNKGNFNAVVRYCPLVNEQGINLGSRMNSVPVKQDGAEVKSVDMVKGECFEMNYDLTKKNSYLTSIGFATEKWNISTAPEGLYSTAIFSNNNRSMFNTNDVVFGGTGNLYAYNMTGSNIWNFSFSSNANSKVYALKAFYNGSQWLVAFMPYLNESGKTYLYILNSSGSLLCTSNDLITGNYTGGGADIDSWDINNSGNRDGLAIIYDNGNKNAVFGAYYQNCSQKGSSQTISTAPGSQTAGIVTSSIGAEVRAVSDSSGHYNRVAVGLSSGSPAPPSLQLAVYNNSIAKVWSNTDLLQMAGLSVGDFRSEDGDEIVACGRTSSSCNLYLWNGTRQLTGAGFATEQYEIPRGRIGSNAFQSFMRHQTSSLFNMTNVFNSSFKQDWAVSVSTNSVTSASSGDYNADGFAEFCYDDGGNLGIYKIWCYNNSGSQMANSIIQGVSGNAWGKGCMKTGNSLDFNYQGDVLIACDNAGYGYLFNFSSYDEGQIIDFENDNITFLYGADGLAGFANQDGVANYYVEGSSIILKAVDNGIIPVDVADKGLNGNDIPFIFDSILELGFDSDHYIMKRISEMLGEIITKKGGPLRIKVITKEGVVLMSWEYNDPKFPKFFLGYNRYRGKFFLRYIFSGIDPLDFGGAPTSGPVILDPEAPTRKSWEDDAPPSFPKFFFRHYSGINPFNFGDGGRAPTRKSWEDSPLFRYSCIDSSDLSGARAPTGGFGQARALEGDDFGQYQFDISVVSPECFFIGGAYRAYINQNQEESVYNSPLDLDPNYGLGEIDNVYDFVYGFINDPSLMYMLSTHLNFEWLEDSDIVKGYKLRQEFEAEQRKERFESYLRARRDVYNMIRRDSKNAGQWGPGRSDDEIKQLNWDLDNLERSWKDILK